MARHLACAERARAELPFLGGFGGAWVGGFAYARGGWPGTVALLLAVQALGWAIAWRFMPPARPLPATG